MTTKTQKVSLVFLGAVAAIVWGISLIPSWSNVASASINFLVPTERLNTYKNYSFLAATTTTATSTNLTGGGGYLSIDGAKKVTFYFSRAWGGGNSGTSAFTVEVTPDGANWYAFNKLIQNVASTTSQTTVGSISISAATSTTVASMDLQYDTFLGVRCIVNETTDGTHTCAASAEY